MKNNRIMKAAGALLVLVLVTSCFVGSTFAKYTTTGTGTDSARVAKFGVNIEANGATFAKEYATDDGSVAGTITKSVMSTENVIAPGTSGEMARMAITGTPEVAVQVNYRASVTLSGNWKDAQGNFYCPLQIKIPYKDPVDGEVTAIIDGSRFTDMDAFIREIENRINSFSANYAAGTDLSTITAGGSLLAPSVSWVWPFSVNEANDVKDTYLGDQAAAGNAASIMLQVTTTVTQID